LCLILCSCVNIVWSVSFFIHLCKFEQASRQSHTPGPKAAIMNGQKSCPKSGWAYLFENWIS
jgi:hypothetical protein